MKSNWNIKAKSKVIAWSVGALLLLAACGGTQNASQESVAQSVAQESVASVSSEVVASAESTSTESQAPASTSEAAPVASEAPASTSTEQSVAPVVRGDDEVEIVAMKGPTAMGIAKYEADQDRLHDDAIDFEVETMPDEVASELVKGEADIAAIPVNLAATLYNKTNGKIQVLGINVTNVLYIAENGDTLQSLANLKGKTIYTTGKGATPEVILTMLLENAGLTPGQDVTIEYLSEASEVAAKLASTPGAIAQLQQPFLTTVTTKNDAVKVKFDMNQEWQKVFGTDSSIVTGVVVARKDFLEKNQAWVDKFLADYAKSVDWTLANPAEAAKLIADLDIVPAPIAEKAIPNAGLVMINGDAMQAKLGQYLEKLFESNPKLVGGKLPQDEFYYLAK